MPGPLPRLPAFQSEARNTERLRAGRGSKEQLGAARSSRERLGAGGDQEWSGATNNWPGTARRSRKQLETVKSDQEQPRAAGRSLEQQGATGSDPV